MPPVVTLAAITLPEILAEIRELVSLKVSATTEPEEVRCTTSALADILAFVAFIVIVVSSSPTEVLALNLADCATIEPPLATKDVPLAYDCIELPNAALVVILEVSATTEPDATK